MLSPTQGHAAVPERDAGGGAWNDHGAFSARTVPEMLQGKDRRKPIGDFYIMELHAILKKCSHTRPSCVDVFYVC